MVMDERFAAIERALKTVQDTLDLLTARGHHETAFELSKAQYQANIRTSWPANMGVVVKKLEEIKATTGLGFSETETAAIADAITTLKGVVDQ